MHNEHLSQGGQWWEKAWMPLLSFSIRNQHAPCLLELLCSLLINDPNLLRRRRLPSCSKCTINQLSPSTYEDLRWKCHQKTQKWLFSLGSCSRAPSGWLEQELKSFTAPTPPVLSDKCPCGKLNIIYFDEVTASMSPQFTVKPTRKMKRPVHTLEDHLFISV